MIILDSKVLLENPNVTAKLYEAPYHTSRGTERMDWIYRGKPFFNEDISSFWNFYMAPLENEFSPIDLRLIQDERRRFIKKPIIVCLNQENKCVGGIWFGESKKINGNKTGTFHIKVKKEFRSCAHPLMGYSLEKFSSLYDAFCCEWGARIPEDDPTNFFLRNNFFVNELLGYRRAFRQLR